MGGTAGECGDPERMCVFFLLVLIVLLVCVCVGAPGASTCVFAGGGTHTLKCLYDVFDYITGIVLPTDM